MLLAWAIALWAGGLNQGRRPLAYKELLLTLQREAGRTIAKQFAQEVTSASFVSSPAPIQASAPQSVWQEGHAFIDHLRDHFQAEHKGLRREVHEHQQETRDQLAVVQYDLHSYELRLAALEARPASPSLDVSPEHLKHVFQLARQLHQRQRLPIVDILAMLAEHFRVEDVSLLPESAWPAVLDWFASLLEEW